MAQMSVHSLVVLSLISVAVHAVDWSNGAQNNNTATPYTSACLTGNFRPSNDDYMPQNTPSPYAISLETVKKDGMYYPGEPITVYIHAINQNDFFEAYHLRGDCSKDVFNGSLTCDGGIPSNLCNLPGKTNQMNIDAVTNSNNTLTKFVKCTWVPPSYSIGSVQFSATIVQSYDKFWTGVLSNTLKSAPTTTSYEEHQAAVVNQGMAKMRKEAAKAMQNYNQMLTKFRSQMGGNMGVTGNMLAGMMGGQQGQNNQQNMMSQMMGMMNGGQGNNRMQTKQNWGFNSFMNGGEAGGEQGEGGFGFGGGMF